MIFTLKSKSDIYNLVSHLSSLNYDLPKIVDVRDYKPKRSTAQNRLLWAYHHKVSAWSSLIFGKHFTSEQIHTEKS